MSNFPGGKGSVQRPTQVTDEIMDLRWKLAFGTDEEKEDAAARLDFLEWQAALNGEREWKPE